MGIFGSDEEKYYDKAHGYFDKGNFEKAIEYLDKVLEINPNSINALNNKGVALKNMGMFDEALNYYNKVLEIEPDHVMTVLNKANILMDNIKDYEKAVEYYNILLKMDREVFMEGLEYPDVEYLNILPHIWNEKGLALFNLKKYQDAIFSYNETLKIDPNNMDALNGKELAENKLGNRQTYGNENFNYQNIEKPLINRYTAQKKSKRSFMSILDTITNISIIIFFLALIGTCIIVFTGLYESYAAIIYSSFILSIAIIVISSIISDGAEEVLRQKIMNTGISAQARILDVNNLEYNHVTRRGIAELILEIYPKTGASYNTKSTVNVGVSDASLVFRPGSTVKVFIDPEDASQVEIEY